MALLIVFVLQTNTPCAHGAAVRPPHVASRDAPRRASPDEASEAHISLSMGGGGAANRNRRVTCESARKNVYVLNLEAKLFAHYPALSIPP